MKTFDSQRICLALVGLLALMTLGSWALAQADPSQIRQEKPREIKEADPAVMVVAQGMLQQAIDAFKQAPAVTCETTVQVESGPNLNNITVNAEFGPDGSMRVETSDSLIVSKNGVLNIVLYSVHDRYLQVPVSSSVTDEIESLLSDRFLAGFEIMMREGEPQETWLDALTMRSVINPRITGLEEVKAEDGRTLSRIFVAGRMGAGWIDYDPDKKLIESVRTEMYPIEEAEGFTFEMNLNTNTTFLKALPKPITFDPGKRTPVSSRLDLDPVTRNRLAAGRPAPVLKLPQLDGTTVDLATLRGKIVVLDFWATWCAPCKRGLPKLDQLYLDHGENTGDVLVYGVDVMERVRKPEDRIQKVSEYWEKQKFKVPTLIALDDVTQRSWGITSLPLLVIIGSDGTIVEIINGFYPDMKARINAAIKRAGES